MDSWVLDCISIGAMQRAAVFSTQSSPLTIPKSPSLLAYRNTPLFVEPASIGTRMGINRRNDMTTPPKSSKAMMLKTQKQSPRQQCRNKKNLFPTSLTQERISTIDTAVHNNHLDLVQEPQQHRTSDVESTTCVAEPKSKVVSKPHRQLVPQPLTLMEHHAAKCLQRYIYICICICLHVHDL
jgi:hypothetical protein